MQSAQRCWKGELFFSFLELGHPSSSVLEHHCSSSQVLRLWELDQLPPGSQALGIGLNYTTSFPVSSACRQMTVGLPCLCNCVSQFYNKSPYIYILLVLFLQKTLTNIIQGLCNNKYQFENIFWGEDRTGNSNCLQVP